MFDKLHAHATWKRAAHANALPCAFIAALLALAALPTVRANVTLVWSFIGAVVMLLGWCAVLMSGARTHHRQLRVSVGLRKQHYVQACVQVCIFAYWGWYWRPVYAAVPLIAAQLAFAYAFDVLLSWSRRDEYVLGFGPFPVIFSTNLFLWFKPDWFYLQFLMVALGFSAKEFIRWNKDGRRAHVFNPSSFPLAIVSVALIATHATHVTWGAEIAQTEFWPPHIYLLIFLVALPAQFLFGVTSMTLSAVATTYLLGAVYHAVTGTYMFFEMIPISVFLGMHLLFTDPSTAPRTELGRILFGMLYAIGVVSLAPAFGFYDKLLPIPVLNVSIRMLDRVARSPAFRMIDPARLGRAPVPPRRYLAYMCVWGALFVALSATHNLGHSSRGYWLPAWEHACRDGRGGACEKLATLEHTYCAEGESGWACNDLGRLAVEGRSGNAVDAAPMFERACNVGFAPGCANARALARGSIDVQTAPPRLVDYSVLTMEGSGRLSAPPLEIYERACTQGWMDGCEREGIAYREGIGADKNPTRALPAFERACAGGEAAACVTAAYQYSHGEGAAPNETRALAYLQKGCDLHLADACRWLNEAVSSLRP